LVTNGKAVFTTKYTKYAKEELVLSAYSASSAVKNPC